ncbi:BcsR/BcsP family cellulose biosynthesis protein [Parapusillimonas sp. JC17]|uniref:BcsR/BcsP family cellulose biosynthesis protein n=1 Tax=Parapusillimonas sp. JC17 TaxID=3445768 RepID=UPI003FA14ED6
MHNTSDRASLALQADDVVSLKQHLPRGGFDYVDVAAAQAHQEALRRWPLLAETHAFGRLEHGDEADARTTQDAYGEPI